ncbi:MAG TPA: rhodanese-like domain-containing protein [Candidatus Levybacteria bacterium]|nr:rhodanese-like domain-containing protein [Candidatus Levybacteria bacterium]
MVTIKNTLKSLIFKPFESFVAIAEYIHTLHSGKGNKMLFLLTIILTTGLIVWSKQIADMTKISMPALSLPVFSSSTQAQQMYDPYVLLQQIQKKKKDIVIVDLRTGSDYSEGHIKNAINVPLALNTQGKEYERSIAGAVEEIRTISKEKTVVVYGHFSGSQFVYDMTQALRKKRVPTYSLAVGWNEWYHFRNLWLPESQWNMIDMDTYVQTNESL